MNSNRTELTHKAATIASLCIILNVALVVTFCAPDSVLGQYFLRPFQEGILINFGVFLSILLFAVFIMAPFLAAFLEALRGDGKAITCSIIIFTTCLFLGLGLDETPAETSMAILLVFGYYPAVLSFDFFKIPRR